MVFCGGFGLPKIEVNRLPAPINRRLNIEGSAGARFSRGCADLSCVGDCLANSILSVNGVSVVLGSPTAGEKSEVDTDTANI